MSESSGGFGRLGGNFLPFGTWWHNHTLGGLSFDDDIGNSDAWSGHRGGYYTSSGELVGDVDLLASAPHEGNLFRVPLGSGGDFITAPELTPLFGECLALNVIDAIQANNWLGKEVLTLIEFGGGRAKLLGPFLRVYSNLSSSNLFSSIGFPHLPKLEIILCDSHDIFLDLQLKAIEAFPEVVISHSRYRDYNQVLALRIDNPILVIANEFLDALPTDLFTFIAERGKQGLSLDDYKLARLFVEPADRSDYNGGYHCSGTNSRGHLNSYWRVASGQSSVDIAVGKDLFFSSTDDGRYRFLDFLNLGQHLCDGYNSDFLGTDLKVADLGDWHNKFFGEVRLFAGRMLGQFFNGKLGGLDALRFGKGGDFMAGTVLPRLDLDECAILSRIFTGDCFRDFWLDWIASSSAISSRFQPLMFELSCQRHDFCQRLASLMRRSGGYALLIDYGSDEFGFGNTTQAVSKHSYYSLFNDLSSCSAVSARFGSRFDFTRSFDVSSHVHFYGVRMAIDDLLRSGELSSSKFSIDLASQRNFLLGGGILHRLHRLSLGGFLSSEQLSLQQSAVERLVSPDSMGHLFKVLTMVHKG